MPNALILHCVIYAYVQIVQYQVVRSVIYMYNMGIYQSFKHIYDASCKSKYHMLLPVVIVFMKKPVTIIYM